MENPAPDSSGVFNRMFLLTSHPCHLPGWTVNEIAEYRLYTHPNLTLSSVAENGVELFLLGYLFDYRVPERSNTDILNLLANCPTFEEMLEEMDECSGTAVLIYKSAEILRVITDACAQREVFYDTTFAALGSQPKLIEKVVEGKPWTDENAIRFYQSKLFQRSNTFVGDTTHRSNIKRLMPNHYADLGSRTIRRFFPLVPRDMAEIADVVPMAVAMLQGYMKAASLRYPLDVGVTAGYDSRLLFLASRGLPCKYFTFSDYGPGWEIDMQVAQTLVAVHGEVLEIREWKKEVTQQMRDEHEASIDFPRSRQMKHQTSDRMFVNGHLSAISKCFYGNEDKMTGQTLSKINMYESDPFVTAVYDQWLNEVKPYLKYGYHHLDLFFWEERSANWAAKVKTEAGLYLETYTPYNSRGLFKCLLQTARKDRDKHFHKLYDAIIYAMSPVAQTVPLNPNRKTKTMRWLKQLHLYNLYRFLFKKTGGIRKRL